MYPARADVVYTLAFATRNAVAGNLTTSHPPSAVVSPPVNIACDAPVSSMRSILITHGAPPVSCTRIPLARSAFSKVTSSHEPCVLDGVQL